MYTPPSSNKKQAFKQAVIYTFMTLLVVAIVFVLILVTLGYRFNRAEGTIEQGGLVQLNSIPSGAALTVDAARLSATTSTKTTLAPGRHTITMSRSGYDSWQKTVDVKSGSILWLNYARLVPTNPRVDAVANLPAVTSTLPSPSRKWLALTTEKSMPSITLADISIDTPKLTTLTLPENAYTKPQDSSSSSFHLSTWDPSSRHLLVEHRYDGKTEWIVADTEDITKSKNITVMFDVPISDAKFSRDDNHILYALMNGDVRKIDIESATISAPLVRGVAEFSLHDKSTIVYTTTIDQTTKSRSVGYYHDGAERPRSITTYSDDGSTPLHISMDKYYNQTYVAVAYGNTVNILRGSLPRSDSDDSLSLRAVTTMAMPEAVSYLSSKTDGRFFVAQHGKSFSVYDLELQKSTTTTVRDESPLTGEVRWLDGYTVWSGLDGRLRLYEFDGANQHDIMPIIPGQNPSLSPNNRYLYAPTVDEKGALHLSRVRLIL